MLTIAFMLKIRIYIYILYIEKLNRIVCKIAIKIIEKWSNIFGVFMKKLAIIPVIFIALLLSCYENFDRARIYIRLGDPPPAGIVKIHVAVFDTSVSDANLISVSTFTTNTVISLEVPTGLNRVFVVVGENSGGYANYSGASNPVSIGDSNTQFVGLSVNTTDRTPTGDPTLTWNAVPGATEYILDYDGGLLYSGPIPSVTLPNDAYFNSRLRAYFSYLNLYSLSYTGDIYICN